MFRIIDRYVIKSFLFSYLVCTFVFVGLLVLGDLFSRLGDILGQDSLSDIMLNTTQYYLYQVPYFYLYVSVALSIMAALFTITKLNKANEIMPMMMGGVSIYRILRPILVLGGIIVVFLYFIQETVVPYTQDRALKQKYRLDEKDEKIDTSITVTDLFENYWYIQRLDKKPLLSVKKAEEKIARLLKEKIERDGPFRSLSKADQDWLIATGLKPEGDSEEVRKFTALSLRLKGMGEDFEKSINLLQEYQPCIIFDMLMRGVSIIRLARPGKFSFQLQARFAAFDPARDKWILHDVVVHKFDPEPTRRNEYEVLAMPVVKQTDTQLSSICTSLDRSFLEHSRDMDIEPAAKTFSELRSLARKRTLKHFDVLLLSRLTNPLSSFVLLLIGISLVFRGESSASTMVGMAMGMAICVTFMVINLWMHHMGGQGVISPRVAVFAPPFVFGSAGVYLFCFMRT